MTDQSSPIAAIHVCKHVISEMRSMLDSLTELIDEIYLDTVANAPQRGLAVDMSKFPPPPKGDSAA